MVNQQTIVTRRRSASVAGERVFDFIVYAIAGLIMLIVLYPLLFVLSASFSDPVRVMNGDLWLLPVGFTLDAYKEIFRYDAVWTGYRNTLLYTGVGTIINVTMTTLAAYPLSRRDLPGRRILMFLITFTMFFNGGMIPTYLVVKNLHLVDTMWAMIVPTAIATYNLIVMRTYFQNSIPWELQEASMIDGCTNTRLLLHIILPLSKPIIAVMVLFYAVNQWNAFFNALIYLRDDALYPLQLVLREILIVSQSSYLDSSGSTFGMTEKLLLAESIKYGLIIIASIPVIMMYPFVQKHFVKGVMIGSIKE
ncbi:carbohydrate ABC transporter membrane protein 2 (CUT1 family) [Paenibacillus cellulosilyticus]|uniref:Carbohydrate ABC transporter membrane protein 2 (CUT1 family) n=1 Tax=Paenibacillus cellulosilyticus TaxID=375489 RepID=A0A2V2YV16_9BACL|nr:carbohydrate ABC transporter permease [Paenibacillus cellulosilyticus]PWW05067.1 carbohydrate ABC transporter membrane protein 2 (CUT1 family) [Paenibacillus cellulosilyticus]QKS48622.1 carbohydrate ABC transporter permease [Paenibacillus cellulosilyticus]